MKGNGRCYECNTVLNNDRVFCDPCGEKIDREAEVRFAAMKAQAEAGAAALREVSDDEILSRFNADGFLPTVKWVRATTGCDLRAAVDAVKRFDPKRKNWA